MNIHHLLRQALLTRQSVFVKTASVLTATMLVALLVAPMSSMIASVQESTAPAGKQSPEAPTKRRTSQTARAGNRERPPADAITGRVVADDGHPVANVSLSFSRRTSTGLPGGVAAATDAEGNFRAENLDPGLYNAGVYLPGYTRATEPDVERGEPRYYRTGENVTIRMTKGGVITGAVRNANGDPVVGVIVRAVFVRQPDGRTPRTAQPFFYGPPRMTDDRGVYRIYGLEPGNYVVSVGGSDQFGGMFSTLVGEMTTYHPSATRDGAAEVTVQAGQETSGIDIRHRGERGRTISGRIAGFPEPAGTNVYGVTISLTHAASGHFESATNLSGRVGDRSFSLDGVSDGEYEIRARVNSQQGFTMASEPQRVTVRGADVTGLNLTLAPLASISGRVTLAAMPEAERGANACADSAPRAASPPESLVIARREEKESSTPTQSAARRPSRSDASPDAQGEFTLQSLDAGRYRLEALPPGEDWYVRTFTVSSAAVPTPQQGARRAAAAQAGSNVARDTSLTLTTGQKAGGVNIVFAEGAASLRGTLPADAGQQSVRQRVHLIPSERERADDPFRYASSSVAADGNFALTNLAPGRYWLLVAAADDDTPPSRQRAGAFDAGTRAKLRRDAEAAAANPIDLQPCQRVNDFTPHPPGKE